MNYLTTVLSAIVSVSLCAPAFAETPVTVGPNGEAPTAASSVLITETQITTLKSANHTAAFVWHELSDYTNAVDRGARAEFERLGIKVVAQTDAGFDPARQKSDVETVMSKSPSIIISLPVDPATAAGVFDIAREAGVSLAFVDNSPAGYKHGEDYVTVVSDDLFQMGNRAGVAMAKALGEKGKVGYIFHDADFYVTNQRDNAFKYTIENDYPNMSIVAEAGMVDPANGEDIARAMLTRNPDLDGVYVTWAEPALGVLSVLREQGNKHTKIVTLDLSEPVALDMVKGGNVAAIIADEAFNIGVTAARAAALGLLKVSVAPFLVVDALAVTKNNVEQGWMQSLNMSPPISIVKLK